MKKELEIYIHIPFCAKKCAYCDFLSAVADQEVRERYVQSLEREIRAYQELADAYRVTTVFVGGGTPSILEGGQMERIFRALRETFQLQETAEITIEANPGTVTREKLEAYRACGINRISFGLQSTENAELQLLGRIHTYEAFLESFRLAREVGFDNINVDLISSIPRQSCDDFLRSLRRIIELQPEHISAYSLIVEEGTEFALVYGEDCSKESELPSEAEERRTYRETKRLLEDAGYLHYEISNYAKEGKECRHNLGYWERTDYLGIGLGAASLLGEVRYAHLTDIESYMAYAETPKRLQVDREVLSKESQIEEFLFLGLRKVQGVSKRTFYEHYGVELHSYYGEQLEALTKQGLLVEEGDAIRLTDTGRDVSNYVLAEFLL